MDRIYVMELVQSLQTGGLGQNEFMARATEALGDAVLAERLRQASVESPATEPPPVIVSRAASAPAADSTGLKALRVEYPGAEGERLEGYFARPRDGEARPGVIVIQEWWGLNDHIRDVTRRFAREGFVALAPDLYHGVVVSEPDEARKLVMELDMGSAVAEIQQAVDFLRSQAYVGGQGVGAVGFCMGGRLVLRTALVEPQLGAVVAFYGTPLNDEEVTRVQAPIMGLYGSEDGSISVDSIRAMEAALDRNGIEHEIHVYQGAGHAFFNDTRSSCHPQAATDAWQRTLAWFHRHLD